MHSDPYVRYADWTGVHPEAISNRFSPYLRFQARPHVDRGRTHDIASEFGDDHAAVRHACECFQA